MATILPNPNRPLLHIECDFTIGPPNLVGANRKSLNSAVRRTLVREIATLRGRQYELDQTQAGTASLTVVDPLEYLNPLNGSSPFMTGGNAIKPYRPLRIGVIWPVAPGSGNLICTTVSTALDPSFETTTGGWTPAGGTTTAVLSTAQFFNGAKSLLVTPSASGAGFGVLNAFRTAPGVTYCFSAYVRPTGGAVQLQVTDATGTVTSSAVASTLNTWQRLSVTWNSADTLESIAAFNTTNTSAFYLDATQLEFGTTPTTFGTTGPTWYDVYNGYVERWPMRYDMAGTRAQHPLTAVDALGILSRTTIAQSYSSTVLADTPAVWIPYNDSAGPHVVQRPTGGGLMQGYTSIGTSGTVNFGGGSFLDGTTAVVVSQQNSNPPTSGNPAYITYLGTRTGELSINPQSSTFEFWFKHDPGTAYFGAAAIQLGEDPNTTPAGPQKGIGAYTAGGKLFWRFDDPNGSGGGLLGSVNNGGAYTGWPDGQWHHAVFVLLGSNVWHTVVDGYVGGTPTLAFTPSASIAMSNLYVDATTYFGDPLTSLTVANWAFYTTALSNAQILAHYQRGIGYSGELSGTRVARMLTQFWGGTTNVATGYAKLSPDYNYGGRTMLDVLQEIQETERGLLYVSRSGTVTFEDRASRYLMQTPLWTIGENPPGASPTEYPYSEFEADYDPTYVFSQANLSRPGNSTVTPVVNATAQADFGQRVLTQTLQVNTDFDVQQAASYYLARYGTPRVRVEKVTLDPASNPALWPLVLSLELSQRLTAKRRTGALTTSGDYYVEQIAHNINPTTGAWTVGLQLSPVFVPSAWVLGDSTYGVLGTTTTPVY